MMVSLARDQSCDVSPRVKEPAAVLKASMVQDQVHTHDVYPLKTDLLEAACPELDLAMDPVLRIYHQAGQAWARPFRGHLEQLRGPVPWDQMGFR